MRAFICIFCLWLQCTIAFADNTALVIQNQNYEFAGVPNTETKIGQRLAQLMKKIGFSVVSKENLGRHDLFKSLNDLARQTEKQDLLIFYFSGFGIQVDNTNFLVPVEAELDTATSELEELVPLEPFIRLFATKSKIVVLLLDASHKAQLFDQFSNRREQFGLSALKPGLVSTNEIPDNVIILTSTGYNRWASNKSGHRGIFTRVLFDHIATPNWEFSLLAKRIIGDVREQSGGAQSPEFRSGLAEPVIIVTGNVNDSKELPRYVSQISQYEQSAFSAARSLGTVAGWKAFITHFPDSTLIAQAKRELANAAAQISQIDKSPATKTSIRRVQSALIRLGCAPGPVDGIWGNNAKSALIKLLKTTNLPGSATPPNIALATYLEGLTGSECKLTENSDG